MPDYPLFYYDDIMMWKLDQGIIDDLLWKLVKLVHSK